MLFIEEKGSAASKLLTPPKSFTRLNTLSLKANSEILIFEWLDLTIISAFLIYLVFLENNVKKQGFQLIHFSGEDGGRDIQVWA